MLTNPQFSEFLQTAAREYHLSQAETEAMTLAVEGSDITAIAEQLQVKPSAIRQRLSQVYHKFAIEGRGPVKLTKLQQLLLSQFQQHQPEIYADSSSTESSFSQERIYIDEAPAARVFYGRTAELTKLQQWIVKDKCQLIALVGMGGVGKSCLAAKLVQQIQNNFDYVIWRSLRYAPTLPEFLAELFEIFSPGEKIDLLEQTGRQISQLMKYLQSFRCLLVIDDLEAIMESHKLAGYYGKGYEVYQDLFERIGESSHQSCLLLNSRDKPMEVVLLEGFSLPVRSLQIGGLLTADAAKIVTSAGINATQLDLTKLVDKYRGNPAALKIMATTIQELFNGDLGQYLQKNELLIGEILGQMLAAQFQGLSDGERKVIYWLAINQQPLSFNQIKNEFLFGGDRPEILGIIESLLRRSLIEKSIEADEIKFDLLPVVKKYAIEQFRQRICEVITLENLQQSDLGLVKDQLLKELKDWDKLEDIQQNHKSVLFTRIAKIFIRIGYEKYNNKDLGSAEFYFRLAMEFEPGRAAAHYNLGSVYWELALIDKNQQTENFAKARNHYYLAAESKNRAGQSAINNLARLEIILDGNYEKAIELIYSILDQVQDQSIKATLYRNLGYAYSELQRFEQAEKYVCLALDLKQSDLESSELLQKIQAQKSTNKDRKKLRKQDKERELISRFAPRFCSPELPIAAA
ncbi:MAG: NB-ARC domain-containing protein [Trichodesmium sp.]